MLKVLFLHILFILESTFDCFQQKNLTWNFLYTNYVFINCGCPQQPHYYPHQRLDFQGSLTEHTAAIWEHIGPGWYKYGNRIIIIKTLASPIKANSSMKENHLAGIYKRMYNVFVFLKSTNKNRNWKQWFEVDKNKTRKNWNDGI